MTASTTSFETTQPTNAPDVRKTATPQSAVRAARLGGAIALTAAASLSFSALCDLARHAGLHRLAALLPIAVDAFAASTLFVAYRLPAGHPARRTTSRTARLALALTIACNGLDHLLDLAGYLLTTHTRNLLLVAVASLPPLIVERLLHLQTALVGETVTVLTGNENGHSLGTAGHVVVEERQNDVQVACHEAEPIRPTRTRPTDEHWLTVAAPVYRKLAERTGRRPTETAFHAALTEALTAVTDDGAVLDGVRSVSLSTAKRVRAVVEAASGPEATDPYS